MSKSFRVGEQVLIGRGVKGEVLEAIQVTSLTKDACNPTIYLVGFKGQQDWFFARDLNHQGEKQC
jgi:hypothetical protein